MRSVAEKAAGWKRILVLAVLAAGLTTQAAAQDRPEQRVRREAMRRGWIGISFRMLEGAAARPGAAVIEDVFPDSPADRAGIEQGDTVVRWNGSAAIPGTAADQGVQPGDSVRLRLRRRGREREVVVVAAPRPGGFARVGPRGAGDVLVIRPGAPPRQLRIRMDSLRIHADSIHRHIRSMLADSLGPRLREIHRLRGPGAVLPGPELVRMPLAFDLDLGMRAVAGAELAEMNGGLADYFGTSQGVLVLRVAPETPASLAGLQAGDVVVAIDAQPVESVRDLRRAIGASRGREVELEVIRRGQRQEVRMRWDR